MTEKQRQALREVLRPWLNSLVRQKLAKEIIFSYGVQKLVDVPDDKYEEILVKFQNLIKANP